MLKVRFYVKMFFIAPARLSAFSPQNCSDTQWRKCALFSELSKHFHCYFCCCLVLLCREKMEEQLEVEARFRQLMAHSSHDSAIDTDSMEWETEVIEFEKHRVRATVIFSVTCFFCVFHFDRLSRKPFFSGHGFESTRI